MTPQARGQRRGPKPNPNRGDPIGYRITSRTRFELQVAATFVGTASHQETIDLAVREFLDRLRTDADGYTEALTRAEAHQQARAGVAPLSPSDR